MAKNKAKKKSGSRKTSARAKAAAPSGKSAKSPRGGGSAAREPSDALRASAKSFAARLLR